jgi:hypothetical protein
VLVSANLQESNMHEKELNRATTEVASSMDISRKATADEIKRGLQTEEKRGFWGIVNSAIPGYLMALGLFVALTPLPASADNDNNDKGIPAELAALQAEVASLQDQVNSLQASNTTLQSQLATVQSNHALLLGPFVNVDPNPEIGVIGPNIIFSGANIHIVSGSGSTDDNGNRTGLGNLIIGYDEPPGSQPLTGLPLNPGDRGGSHNLVIGRFNRFTQAAFGGLVAGEVNTISNVSASVTGGDQNAATGAHPTVTGGEANTASGQWASVSGGDFSTASGLYTSVSGGANNTASGYGASVSGGLLNISSAAETSVLGGAGNQANFFESVVIGGHNVTNQGGISIAPQPPFP